MNRCFYLTFLLSMLSPAQPPSARSGPETIHIDFHSPGKPFPHYWETTFGSGRAVLSLRQSWRDDLRAVRAATGVQYIRFHGIFDEEMGVVNPDGSFNFSYID